METDAGGVVDIVNEAGQTRANVMTGRELAERRGGQPAEISPAFLRVGLVSCAVRDALGNAKRH